MSHKSQGKGHVTDNDNLRADSGGQSVHAGEGEMRWGGWESLGCCFSTHGNVGTKVKKGYCQKPRN